MSASREKKNRQDQISSGWSDPKTAREAQQRKQEKRSNLLYGAIAVVFVIVAAVSIIWRSNIIPKTATAATIDGEKYSVADVNFYYYNAYNNFVSNASYYTSYLGLDTSSSLKSQTITDSAVSMMALLGLGSAEVGQTWYDYFLDTALNQMATVQAALAAAEAEGFVYPDSVQSEYDAALSSLQTVASANSVSVDQYLQANFGSYMTEKVYQEHLMRLLQYGAYYDAYGDSLTYTDAEVDAAYNDDLTSYDKVAYEAVTITGAAESTTDEDGNTVEPTEEEEAAAKEAAKTAAEEILAAYQAGENLETLAEDNENAVYTNNESGSYTGTVLTEWLFDSARKEGDCEVLESGTTYYVAVFHDRFRDEYNTVAVRHILLTIDDSELDTESDTYDADLQALKDEVKAEAEALLAEWKAGEATEDSFAALANEKSEDGGSNTNGGLYSQFPHDYMVQEFNDWSFDPARKPGDTGIVYGESTSYKGYHIMYFVGEDLPYWKVQVISNLKTADYAEWVQGLAADSTIEQHDSGMKFVG